MVSRFFTGVAVKHCPKISLSTGAGATSRATPSVPGVLIKRTGAGILFNFLPRVSWINS